MNIRITIAAAILAAAMSTSLFAQSWVLETDLYPYLKEAPAKAGDTSAKMDALSTKSGKAATGEPECNLAP